MLYKIRFDSNFKVPPNNSITGTYKYEQLKLFSNFKQSWDKRSNFHHLCNFELLCFKFNTIYLLIY